MEGELSGHHWDALRRLLPVYQAITSVSLGDGATTSFWFDVWHDKGCFADRFPALFTHCMVKTQLVRHVVQNGIRDSLVPRLSASAREELHALEAIVTGTTLTGAADRRRSPFILPNGKLQTSLDYKLLAPQRDADTTPKFT
jgi:hypothetical protein